MVSLYEKNIPKDSFTLVDSMNELNTLRIKNYRVRELQEIIFENGNLVYKDSTILEKQQYCADEMATLYPEVKRSENPHQYYVDLTRNLLELKKELIMKAKSQNATEDVSNTLRKKL